MREEKFYKLAKPDGFDFYTGKTINYRENIGKTVRCPGFDARGELCSTAFIHASREPNRCFIGARIPCSAYEVRGVPILEDADKAGFGELFVVKELNPSQLFKWRYSEACKPVKPFEIEQSEGITEMDLKKIHEWASVWYSVWDSVWASVWASVRDSVRDSVWDSVGDSVWAYTGHIFAPAVRKWKYIEHKRGVYPFQSAVDLWMQGLVPSYDGKLWRLHSKNGIEWEGELKEE